MSETEVAMSSMIMSSSVLAGCMMAAKYSVMLGELHLASTDTSCIRKQLEHCNELHNSKTCLQQRTYFVDVLNVILTA